MKRARQEIVGNIIAYGQREPCLLVTDAVGWTWTQVQQDPLTRWFAPDLGRCVDPCELLPGVLATANRVEDRANRVGISVRRPGGVAPLTLGRRGRLAPLVVVV